MLTIRNTIALLGAIESDIDPPLRALLVQRGAQISECDDRDFGELAHMLVIQAGDTLKAVEAELGFSPLVNFVDEARYGEPDFMPSWEWIERHDGWFELAYVLSDDGFGWIVFVQDADGVDPELLALCNNWAG
jgi:hypothetical protein